MNELEEEIFRLKFTPIYGGNTFQVCPVMYLCDAEGKEWFRTKEYDFLSSVSGIKWEKMSASLKDEIKRNVSRLLNPAPKEEKKKKWYQIF